MKQKPVTIFPRDRFDKAKGGYGHAEAGPFFGVKERLTEYLDQGWTMKEIRTVGGPGGVRLIIGLVLPEESWYIQLAEPADMLRRDGCRNQRSDNWKTIREVFEQ